MAVCPRLGWEPIECLLEENGCLFALSLTPVDQPEVGDDLSFVLLVAQCVQDVPRLLEVLDGLILGAALCKCEREAVQRQRLGLLVP